VKFSSTFRRYFSSAGRNLPRKCACCSADSSAYCVYCVIALNSVFSNIVAILTPVIMCVINLNKSYLVLWLHSFLVWYLSGWN